MVLGLTSITALAGRGRVLPAILMAILGVMLSTVGTDSTSGLPRFTFGRMDLVDGFSFLLLAMSTFALAEVLLTVRDGGHRDADRPIDGAALGSMRLSRAEVKHVAPAVARSSLLGFLIGILPGAGATIASFIAYGTERNIASGREAETFGKGSLRGVAAPEAANNAASTGSFVPMLTLGIPGSGTTAIMLGALVAYGIQPGPRLLVDNPEIFWSVIVSMYVGNVVLLIMNLPLIPYLSRLLAVPRPILIPVIIAFCMIGVYLVSFNAVDILIMAVIAVAAIGLRLLDFPMAPMLLGFILGGYLEDNLQRALIIHDGSWSFLWERPSTLTLVILTLLLLAWPLAGRLLLLRLGVGQSASLERE
jgi:putative tricarboxylic transport membrane protein